MVLKNYIKIIISIVMLAILALTMYLISDHSNDDVNTDEDPLGEIYFQLFNEDESLVVDDTLSFYQGDNLFTLLNRNYDLVCANAIYEPDDTCSYRFLYGRVILEIEDVDSDWTTKGQKTVLSIYINDSLSTKGASLIKLNDQDRITIRKSDVNE